MISQLDQLILDHNHIVWEPGFGFSTITTSTESGLSGSTLGLSPAGTTALLLPVQL